VLDVVAGVRQVFQRLWYFAFAGFWQQVRLEAWPPPQLELPGVSSRLGLSVRRLYAFISS
jgi:hypothetical protein